MDTVLTLRKRGRPPGHKQFTERLPSVLATPTDVEKLAYILAARHVTASALLRELIAREHRRLLRTSQRPAQAMSTMPADEHEEQDDD